MSCANCPDHLALHTSPGHGTDPFRVSTTNTYLMPYPGLRCAEATAVGGNVLRAVATPGGGALLQLDSGELSVWSQGAGLARCEHSVCFGAPCPLMRATPAAALAPPGAPCLQLDHLFCSSASCVAWLSFALSPEHDAPHLVPELTFALQQKDVSTAVQLAAAPV